MADRRKPDAKKPGDAPDIAETNVPQEVLPEGQIPGMPVSSDPLLQPMPHPRNREVPPLD